ncbi:MAG: hypothetical protein HETSPECPRED_001201 [Heterodermia speciosa]|uniref:Heterokaryon incompatibility domain-containing protein n=1 Tax=Heterodermia speciosa TaxID=116794 RepID=A0A8H3IGH2_9LECA|nr:MAG: hypothetical protein HETSPECPRED_001201 [Heterodermia speciosa]
MDVGYTYSGLDFARREIRLLQLLPGDWEEPLLCNLQVISLNDQPKYQGLSYAWGKPGIFKTIQLHGKPFEITVNLWVALRRLRSRHHDRIIWADAICINQKDLEERSSQVTLMGEIFSGASEVLIWLGNSISEEDGSLESSPGILEHGKDIKWLRENVGQIFIFSAFPNHESEALAAFGTLHLLSVDEHWTDKPLFIADGEGRYHIAENYVLAWQATLKLLQLSWWSRVWVVQELALSRSATLVLGSVSAPWELISKFCHSYRKHLPPGACCHSSATWKMSSSLWADIVFMRLTVWNFHASRTEMVQPPSKPPHSAFLEFLWLLRHKEASDPRDKVYGLLGLLHGRRPSFLVPDYSMSNAETFSRCTEALIKSDNSLNALVGPILRRPGLPSWAIDLLPNENAGSVLFFQNISKRITSSAIFNACGMQRLRYSLKLSKLRLCGIPVDVVKDTAMTSDEGFVAHAFREWENLSCAGSVQVYPSGCTRAEAFWRTMIRDTIRDYEDGEAIRRANNTDELAYMCFRRWLVDQSDTKETEASPDFANFRKSFFIATQYQRFFTTHKDYMGLSDLPQSNDEIWILFGGSVPFILRPYPANSDHAGSYSLIGDCYVHGIMDGEAIEEWQEKDTREIFLV